ncbi:MAG: hypothetical protein PVI26_08945 [Chitinispirillia bacterium]|jgi:nucleoside phosphorylase
MISFIYATIPEARPFIDKVGIPIDSKIAYPFHYECKVGSNKFIFSISGIGISLAKKCTIELMERYPVQHVYNIGICGMVNDALSINELYCVSKALFWQGSDQGINRQSFTCKPEFFDKKKHVTLATCTKPVFDSGLRKKIALYADIVDMEGAAIAEVCSNNSVACTLIKGVSDGADKAVKKTLHENMKFLSKRMTEIIWDNL